MLSARAKSCYTLHEIEWRCSDFIFEFFFRAVEKAPRTALVGVLVDGKDATKVSEIELKILSHKIMIGLINLKCFHCKCVRLLKVIKANQS